MNRSLSSTSLLLTFICVTLTTAGAASTTTTDRAAAFEQAGIRALKKKNDAGARVAFQKCVDLDAARTTCWLELGYLAMRTKSWADAVVALEHVHLTGDDGIDVEQALDDARAQAALEVELANESAPNPAPKTVQKTKRTVRLRAVGDVMLGTDFPEGYLPPDDGKTLLDDVAPLLRDADLTFVNLEGPLCDDGETKKCRKGGNCYAFRTPTRYGAYLKDAGVDIASVANNHSGDFGSLCRRQTEKTLDTLGIVWSGPPGTIATAVHDGIKVGLVAFHTSSACNDVNNHRVAALLVKKAAKSHDVVLVSFHGGAEGASAVHVPDAMEEFYGEERGHLRAFARVVVDAGADVVIGHGPHVLRGMELYRDRLVVYSLGNFATFGRFNLKGPLGVGAVLDVELGDDGAFLGGKIIPTRQEGAGVPAPDPTNQAVEMLRTLSREDFPNGDLVFDDDGTLRVKSVLPGHKRAVGK